MLSESRLPNISNFPSDSLLADLVPLTAVSGRPDLVAHQAPDVFALWTAWEHECGSKRDVPYWATVWPAALLLAKFMGENPELVRQKSVLDFGCGGGIAGLAALKSGASKVIANDIDPIALGIAEKNAVANHLALVSENADLLSTQPPSGIDIILVGDMFYDRNVSVATLAWLEKARRTGSRVYIADASRPFAPTSDVEILREEIYPTDLDLEGRLERRVRLLAFQP